ncbi:hypothetical protein RIF29_27669 [Crotalaria pallida]|uniref:Uncharacterized protein n=1 Tax=Crotalaria pallida TaxID=3830 RepID=A0AAN9EUD1_CROPI
MQGFFKDLTGFERCSSLKGLKECVNFDVPSMPNICFAICTQNFRNCLHNTSHFNARTGEHTKFINKASLKILMKKRIQVFAMSWFFEFRILRNLLFFFGIFSFSMVLINIRLIKFGQC